MHFARHRIDKELQHLSLPPNIRMQPLCPATPPFLYTLTISIVLSQGVYADRELVFDIMFTPSYPFTGPKIFCRSKIFHPNIDNGCVCMRMLREEWTCGMDIEYVINSLMVVLVEFDGEDALNVEAGDMLVGDPEEFFRIASSYK